MQVKVYTPERKKYSRKYITKTSCPFCSKNNLRKYKSRSLSSKNWNVLANPYPYLDGNLIVSSKNHLLDLDSLTTEEWSELQYQFITIKSTLAQMFKTKSFNIGLNIGPEAGGTIEHLHFQIIPRSTKNASAISLVADLQNINVSPEDLLKKIDNNKP